MRAVDSPYTPGNAVGFSGIRVHRYPNTRLFKMSPRYKQQGPYTEDCCLWRDDVFDYLGVVPPWYR